MDTLNISKNLVNAGLEQKIADVIANTFKSELEQEVKKIKKEFVKNSDLLLLKNDNKDLRWLTSAGFGLVLSIVGAGFTYVVSLLNTIIATLPSIG